MSVREKILRIFNFWLAPVATLGSIVGLVSLFALDPGHKGAVALAAVIVFLLVVLWLLYRTVTDLTKRRYPDGYSSISTEVTYSTNDGHHIDYTVYRYIQVRKPMMDRFTLGYKWSGDKLPIIKSDLQTVGEGMPGTGDRYDRVVLLFKEPLIYNDVALIHTHIELDDSSEKSSTHVGQKVEHPTQMLILRIQLGYKSDDFDEPAVLSRKQISSDLPKDYELVTKVHFDRASKSYFYRMPYPEPGYFYRLAWNRRK